MNGNANVIDLAGQPPPLDTISNMYICICMNFRDPLSEMIWWNENLSLPRRDKARRTAINIEQWKSHIFRFTKMLMCDVCHSIFSSVTIFDLRVKRFFVELNFSSISELTHLRFAVYLFFKIFSVCMSVCNVQCSFFASRTTYEMQTLRGSLFVLCRFLMCSVFFLLSTDVMPRLKYMHTNTHWCACICILSEEIKNMVIIWQKITNNNEMQNVFYFWLWICGRGFGDGACAV